MLKGMAKNRKEGVGVEKVDTLPQGLWLRLLWMENIAIQQICIKMVEKLMETKTEVVFSNEHLMHASTVPGAITCGGLLEAERLYRSREEYGNFKSCGML